MADTKFSAFPSTTSTTSGDTVVGLHSGANEQFVLSPTPAASAIALWDSGKNFSAVNLIAGASGTAGVIESFPATASKGSLIIAAVNNTGNTNTTISNAAMGQASVVSIPDPGTATANFAVAPSALVGGNLVSASGTAGLIQDSGLPSTAIINWKANSNASISAAVNNGYILTHSGATTITLPTTFAVGSLIGVVGTGSAWTVDIGASTNVIAFGNTYTTSFASANNTDSLVLVATVANTTWSVLSMSSIGLTAS